MSGIVLHFLKPFLEALLEAGATAHFGGRGLEGLEAAIAGQPVHDAVLRLGSGHGGHAGHEGHDDHAAHVREEDEEEGEDEAKKGAVAARKGARKRSGKRL